MGVALLISLWVWLQQSTGGCGVSVGIPCACMHVCARGHTLCLYACVCACMRVCVCVLVCACAYVCVRVQFVLVCTCA